MERENRDPDDDLYAESSSDDDEQAEDHGLPPHKSKQERHENSWADQPSHHDQYGFVNRTLGIGGHVRAFQKDEKYGGDSEEVLEKTIW